MSLAGTEENKSPNKLLQATSKGPRLRSDVAILNEEGRRCPPERHNAAWFAEMLAELEEFWTPEVSWDAIFVCVRPRPHLYTFARIDSIRQDDGSPQSHHGLRCLGKG